MPSIAQLKARSRHLKVKHGYMGDYSGSGLQKNPLVAKYHETRETTAVIPRDLAAKVDRQKMVGKSYRTLRF